MVERVEFSYYNEKREAQPAVSFCLQALSIYFKELSVSGKNPVVYNMKNYIHCDHECITDRRIICVKN